VPYMPSKALVSDQYAAAAAAAAAAAPCVLKESVSTAKHRQSANCCCPLSTGVRLAEAVTT